MVVISKDEKEIISQLYPDTHIVRTMRQKSKRHRYYMAEDKEPMAFLNDLRNKK